MRRAPIYRSIQMKMIRQPWFRRLSDRAKLVVYYTCLGTETCRVAGLSITGPAIIADTYGWTIDEVHVVLEELERDGVAHVDLDAGLVWVPAHTVDFPPMGPKQIQGCATTIRDMLPDVPITRMLVRTIADSINPAHWAAFASSFATLPGYKGFDTVSDTVSDTASIPGNRDQGLGGEIPPELLEEDRRANESFHSTPDLASSTADLIDTWNRHYPNVKRFHGGPEHPRLLRAWEPIRDDLVTEGEDVIGSIRTFASNAAKLVTDKPTLLRALKRFSEIVQLDPSMPSEAAKAKRTAALRVVGQDFSASPGGDQ